jgi:hypothetical protein
VTNVEIEDVLLSPITDNEETDAAVPTDNDET